MFYTLYSDMRSEGQNQSPKTAIRVSYLTLIISSLNLNTNIETRKERVGNTCQALAGTLELNQSLMEKRLLNAFK